MKTPNPIWHALIVWASHSSNWSIVFGCVLGIVAAIVPRWAGLENITAICDQLAVLLPLIFAAIGVAQKYADGKTQGESSAYQQYLKLKDGDK
jgi:hypothetical protein